MRYIVDGYNVAHFLFGSDGRRATPEQLREAVLRRLRRFGTRRRSVTVVFDAEATPSFTRSADVEVRYARDADDEIVRLVRESADPSSLRVVSRDRELTARARQLGARIVRVIDFLDILEDAVGEDIEPGEPPEKYDP